MMSEDKLISLEIAKNKRRENWIGSIWKKLRKKI